MSETVIVAILAFIGTVAGSGLSIMAQAKLTNYKIDELKKQVEAHNGLIDRTYKLEKSQAVQDQEIIGLDSRLKEVEKNVKN